MRFKPKYKDPLYVAWLGYAGVITKRQAVLLLETGNRVRRLTKMEDK